MKETFVLKKKKNVRFTAIQGICFQMSIQDKPITSLDSCKFENLLHNYKIKLSKILRMSRIVKNKENMICQLYIHELQI